MTRSNRSPSAGSTIVSTLRSYEGGTGQTTAPAARTAMNLVAKSELNQPNGIAALDSAGKIQISQVPDNGPAPFGVQGPSSVTVGSSTNFLITNYDIFTSYTLTAISGTVDRDGDTINYAAPIAAGAGGFTLNGRVINVAIANVQPNTPTLAAVDVGSGVSAAAFNCTGSAFSMNSGSGTHASSDWQVASDAAFNTIVSQSLVDTTNKTSWTSGSLALNATYYARVRYRDNTGTVGEYSNVVQITTKSTYIISTEEAKIIASDKAAGDQFGTACAINYDGTRVAVTAVNAANGATAGAGAVYIFVRSGTTWTQEQKLQAPNAVTNAHFGSSVSISDDGTRVAVGAKNDTGSATTNAGAAYVFLRTNNTWALEQKIFSDGTVAAYGFGSSIALSKDGTRVIVGEPGTASVPGSSKIFLRTGSVWTFEATFKPTGTLTNGNQWGSSVAINNDGTRVAISSTVATVSSLVSAGIVVTATRSGVTWTQEASIPAPNPEANGAFGSAIALSSDNNRLVVGSRGATISGVPSAGAAYVFLRSGVTWPLEQKVNASDRTGTNTYGNTVSISADGSRFAIGNSASGSGGVAAAGQGYAYIRNGTVWAEQNILAASDKTNSDLFASAVAISGNNTRIISTSPQADPSGINLAGAAYIYR